MRLAIVIPAYKSCFLEKTLASLANQTNKDFKIYVGDDHSPEDIRAICEKFKDLIPMLYHRFDENMGGIDLVGQWERCVSLSKDEEWIWLFSDDDIADKNCVAAFYDTLAITNYKHEVYRFNTIVIDANDNELSTSPESPFIENQAQLCLHILLSKRGNSMPDHIFKRSKYETTGGFVNFAFGQSADWATSMLFASPHGLVTIPNAKVKWRYSSENLSALASTKKNEMIEGYFSFINWLHTHIINPEKSIILRNSLKEASLVNIRKILTTHYQGVPLEKFKSVSQLLSTYYQFSFFSSLSFCAAINVAVLKYQIKKTSRKTLKYLVHSKH